MKFLFIIAGVISILICWMIRDCGVNPNQGILVAVAIGGLLGGWAISETAHVIYKAQ